MVDTPGLVEKIAQGGERIRRVQQALGLVIVGQDETIHHLLAALLAGGHVLLVGVPGLAKTLLVRTLAAALGWRFRRVQFTPDLMPSDILGSEVLHTDPATGGRTFKFAPGPVFANLLLADEINRTPPKTQAALLQAMQEREVTISGRTHKLAEPFFVLATQNPIEQEGTYPLPEAALDRFMFMVYIDYPTAKEEHLMVKQTTTGKKHSIVPVLDAEDMTLFQEIVRMAPVSDTVIGYCIRLARATRPTDSLATTMVKKYFKWGAGPRSGQFMTLGAKALALTKGRITPSFEDVKAVSRLVLRHRVIPNFNAEADGISIEAILSDLVEKVSAPK